MEAIQFRTRRARAPWSWSWSVAMVVALIAGLGVTGLPALAVASPASPAAEEPALAWTVWHLAAIQTGPDEATSPDDPAMFSLVFGASDQVTVTTSCATATGTIAVRANHDVVPDLTISGTCERRSLPERFLNDLNLASSWVFADDGALVLNLAADGGFIRLDQALTGTTWRWTGFQGGDGTDIAPGDAVTTLTFHDDGTVRVDAGCARGTVPYTSEGTSGLAIDASGLDTSGCAEGSAATRLVRDLAFMRSFVFREGRLFVSLVADGGIHAFVASGS